MIKKTESPHQPSDQSAAMLPVVGIGASAGGLEALEQFLRHLPTDCGIAFVIIQHLAPDRVCMLSDLLQRVTTMKVVQAKNASRVKPDCVYVIPPDKNISIRNHTLYLHKPLETHGMRLPINFFMQSLAEDGGKQSVGVILSGMGTDGTLGMKAIKEQGGLVLVQEPSTAGFDSMPKSVIDAGIADVIAPAGELPARLLDCLRRAATNTCAELCQSDRDQEGFARIIKLLKAKTRHDFSLYKINSLNRRIERRMAVHNIDSVVGYSRFLQKNEHEVELLFKELLIGVTSFFRDAVMWDELKNDALPKILARYPQGGLLRAWSCGCSTGEEAYSLAMLFRESLDHVANSDRYSLQIFATDLDNDAVEKARKGIFAGTIDADVSPERLQRFFIKEEKQYRVCRDIREMVTFAQQNVAMDPPFTKLDLLICRNLLIYLAPELQNRLLSMFHYSLKPGGLLFLGSAESIGTYSDFFTMSDTRAKLFWRNESSFNSTLKMFPISFVSTNYISTPQESLMPKAADNLQQLADNYILRFFSEPTVMINDQGDIIYVSGRTGKYLEPAAGKANLNIFAMAREGLRYELGSAFTQALQQHEPVKIRGKVVEADGRVHVVDMTVVRIEAPEPLQGMVMISFKDVVLQPKARRKKSGEQPDSKRVEELEQELQKVRDELRSTRDEMQASHEELKSTNEELQSTNEELQSTNEELTTSKEEMQSMNEELQTVNAEQESRLDEFMRISNDMENLLNSTEIVTVFLDNQLQVRRFTTGANRLFKLIPGDLGRPLTDIVSNLDYPLLYEHVQDVLRKLVSVETKVSTLDGRWFLVRIMPYRTMDKMIDGVVITCNDITVAKSAEDDLRKEVARLETLLQG